MLTSELRAKLPDDTSHVILDFGEEAGKYNAGSVQDLTGTEPTDTIIEYGDERVRTSSELRSVLEDQDPDGDAQLFLEDVDVFAYYDVREVRVNPDQAAVYLIAGAFRTGGG